MRDYLGNYGVEAAVVRGVHLLVAESFNTDRINDDKSWRAAVVLMVASNEPDDHRAGLSLWQPGQFYRTASCAIEADLTDVGRRIGDGLSRSTSPASLDYANVVLQVQDGMAQHDVQRLIDAAREPFGPGSVRVVLVSGSTEGCRTLRGIDGYVLREGDDSGKTAATVFRMLTTDVAPSTWSCLGFEDFSFEPDPRCAGRIARALYHRGAGQLLWATDQERARVSSASIVVATIEMSEASLTELRVTCAALRGVMRDDASFAYGAPLLKVGPITLPDGFADVIMLTRSDTQVEA